MNKPQKQKRETSWHVLTCDNLEALESEYVKIKNIKEEQSNQDDKQDNDDYAWVDVRNISF
jgi:hypothetical protein